MALVVESTSSASANNSASVTVTKPTGVTAGDLLLILTHEGGTCSGFSTAFTGTNIIALYKIADSGDEAASNYSVSHGDSNNSGIVAMMRVSGWVSGNPIFESNSYSTTNDVVTPIVLGNSGLTLNRGTDNCLMIIIVSVSSGSISNTGVTHDAYGVTSGESNPTWTEIVDAWCEVNAGANDQVLAVAYAVTTNNSDITAWTVTSQGDSLGATDNLRASLITILAPNSETGTLPFDTVEVTDFNPSLSTDTAPTLPLGNVSITDYEPTADAREVTQWTNESKPTTTWTNEEK